MGELKRHVVHIGDEVSQPILPTRFGPKMTKRAMRLPILPNLSTFGTLHCGHVNTWGRVLPVGKPIPARTAKFPD